MVYDTLAFAARIQEVRTRFGEFIGLPGPQYSILMAIAHRQDEGVGVNGGRRASASQRNILTTEVNKLVATELVEKRAHPHDRQRVLLRITDKARARLAELSPIQIQGNDALFDCLDEKSFRTLRSMMTNPIVHPPAEENNAPSTPGTKHLNREFTGNLHLSRTVAGPYRPERALIFCQRLGGPQPLFGGENLQGGGGRERADSSSYREATVRGMGVFECDEGGQGRGAGRIGAWPE
jgi:DNA-binding MarR family transcriptional regulator